MGRARRFAVALSAVVVCAACGTGVSHRQVVEAAHGVAVPAGATEPNGGTATTAPAQPGTGIAAGPAGATSAPGSGAAVPTGLAPVAAGTAAPTTQKPGVGPSGAAPKGAKTSTSSKVGPTAAGGKQDTSPIIIGSVGNYSGAPGAVLKPEPDTLQVWAKMVNAQGGILGHPVKVIVVDDGSDPSKYRQAVQDLVENQHVVAFVDNGASQTADAGQSYLEGKKVPVVGAGDGNKAWTSSPVYFNMQAPTGALVDGALKLASQTKHVTKIALLYCVEATVCGDYNKLMPTYAARNGMKIVYSTSISVTQVDFTSQCLAAQSNGADLVIPVGDQNTFHRVYSDCSRQGYKPSYVASAPSSTDSQVSGLDGVFAASGSVSFNGVPGNAASDEYLNALKTYNPALAPGIFTALGWIAAKTFQHVAEQALAKGGPLTSAEVLSGMAALQSFNAGGLSLPLTYAAGKANDGTPFCWFPYYFSGGTWTGPTGTTPVCDNP